MTDATEFLSDAARVVVDRTLARVQNSLPQEQVTGLRQLVVDGRLFDVDALIGLADLPQQPDEVGHGN